MRGIFAPALLALTLSGCFAYTPVALDSARPGEDVRVRISAEQAREIDALLLRETQVLDGRLLEVGPSFLLEVPVASNLQGGAMQSLNQRIRLDRSGIVGVELRQLDRTRTGIVVGGAGIIVLGAVVWALSRELGGDTRTDPPPPAEWRGRHPSTSPLLRLQP